MRLCGPAIVIAPSFIGHVEWSSSFDTFFDADNVFFT